jgi:2-phosphosulfolactate phosphatase
LQIQIYQLIEGAKKAQGLTVVIDVFRAFTVACYAYANGAEDIIPVGRLEDAYDIKKQHPDYLLIGERLGRIQPGFNFGNSPAQIEKEDFTGKTVIHTTSAGTQGIVNAVHASEIITGSFVNAKAVTDYIKSRKPENVSIVCMGDEGVRINQEDNFCANYMLSLINGTPFDLESMKESLIKGSGKRFFDIRNSDWCPEGDFHLAMAFNRFNFVLKAEKDPDGMIHLRKLENGGLI